LDPAAKRDEIEIDDPLQLFARWWNDEPVPVILATAMHDGRPSARAVVLEEVDERGVAFWTSAESPAGLQLAANPLVALVALWDGRQARIEGRVERVSDEENERHWAGREGKRQLVAFRQSEPIGSREELEALVERVPDEPPRPDFWLGYRVVPELFEFWSEDEEYVHDRFRYTREGPGWTRQRLQP
jgi:pyridoxamine 5'-phosphate oxidase